MASRRVQTTLNHITGAQAAGDETYPPNPAFAKHAHISSEAQYREMWEKSIADPSAFWGEIAKGFQFYKPWNSVMSRSDLAKASAVCCRGVQPDPRADSAGRHCLV